MIRLTYPQTCEVKCHYVSTTLAKDIEDELFERFAVRPEKRDTVPNLVNLDPGSTFRTDCPMVEFDSDGYQVRCSAQHFEFLADSMEAAKLRYTPSGKAYYKIHGAYYCMVIVPRAFTRIRSAVLRRVKTVASQYERFLVSKRQPPCDTSSSSV